MRKIDFNFNELFYGKGNRSSQKFLENQFNDIIENKKGSAFHQRHLLGSKFSGFFKYLWKKPEIQIIFLLIVSRMFFIIFTHWGMDFDFYIEIAQRVLAGEKLYVDIQSTHMPLVDIIYVAMYIICPWKGNIIALRLFMKFPYLVADIGIAFAIIKIVEKEKLKRDYDGEAIDELSFEDVRKTKLIAGYFIAFSLPLILQTGGGRYDSLMIFCFTMVVFCIQRNNWFGIGFYAALGTSTKYIGIIFLPFVIFWMKKEDIIPFILGLLLGFLPIFPFLITVPNEFIQAILLRDSHIAYGFSIWHAIYIFWNGFKMKYIGGIDDTYASADEPWFVKHLYLPLFIIMYAIIFFVYIFRYKKYMRSNSIGTLPLSTITNFVFIPLFIFSLSFKAINIQVLAWLTPYFALRKKLVLLLEYSILTIVSGLALIFFEASNSVTFLELSKLAASENTPFYTLIVNPALKLTQVIPVEVWVSIILITIVWFLIRTGMEFTRCSRELLKKETIHKIFSATI